MVSLFNISLSKIRFMGIEPGTLADDRGLSIAQQNMRNFKTYEDYLVLTIRSKLNNGYCFENETQGSVPILRLNGLFKLNTHLSAVMIRLYVQNYYLIRINICLSMGYSLEFGTSRQRIQLLRMGLMMRSITLGKVS